MKKQIFLYEIFLKSANISESDWNNYLKSIAKFLGVFSSFKIVVKVEYNKIRYFLVVKRNLPNSFNMNNFLIKKCSEKFDLEANFRGFRISLENNDFKNWNDYFYKKNSELNMFLFYVRCYQEKVRAKSFVFYQKNNETYYKIIYTGNIAKFLSIDFESNKSYCYNKCPKYLKIDKILHLLRTNKEDTILEVDTFPYLSDTFYLKHDSYDFYKHSLVIGASGSGKSKFLASLISNTLKNNEKYRVVVIDPHDALKKELWQIQNSRIIDFKNEEKSIELFKSNVEDINASVELSLSLFKTLIDNYNSKLERVLRFSIYILTYDNAFSFINLRKLLLDLDYRNTLVNKLKQEVPSAVLAFFLNDFNEIKTQFYGEAISPIIAFIDEMQMVPVFNQSISQDDILRVINNNFLTIFSLNRLTLGDKVTKTIAGFILQQIFLIAQTGCILEHLIVVIDEVAILENPILARFLAEMRKFNVSVILSGQYFHQISNELQEAILTNTSNYYLFKVSKTDAKILDDNLDIKLEEASNEDRINFLTSLKSRECLVRISKNGTNYPVFKARTTDYLVPEYKETKIDTKKEDLKNEKFDFNFEIGDANIHEVMKNISTSRKEDIK